MEIIQIINSLKPHKAPGVDMITAETLKEIATEIASPLVHLINKVIEDGICPPEFKVAVIKPLNKNGDKTVSSNYRPISLITSITKVFEKVLKTRIESFIQSKKLISERQFGFQRGKSTEDAICTLINLMYKTLDDGKPALCLFLDLAKAFDTVDHSQLLEALQDLGFRGNIYNLMASYLNNRKQFVKINSYLSRERIVECGVPQGTILGPILFTIYINSLLDLKSSGTIISFADDTVIFYADKTWRDLKHKVEDDFSNIIDWFNHKLLTINFKKTMFLPITCYKNTLPNYDKLIFNKQNGAIEIGSTDKIKYLGITIDKHLRWDYHINNVTNTLRTILFKFKYLRNLLDIVHLKIIYYALVESRLSYGILGWGGIANSHLKKLEILQRWFIKVMFKKERTYSSELLYSEARILDIRQIYFLRANIFQYKNKALSRFTDYTYETRNKSKKSLKISFCAKSVGQRSLAFMAPRFFNSLTLSLKNTSTIYKFKKDLKTYTLNAGRNKIHELMNLKQ